MRIFDTSGPIILERPTPPDVFPIGTRLRVKNSAEHGSVKLWAIHEGSPFYVLTMDAGGEVIAWSGHVERARPHQGWKPTLIGSNKKEQ